MFMDNEIAKSFAISFISFLYFFFVCNGLPYISKVYTNKIFEWVLSSHQHKVQVQIQTVPNTTQLPLRCYVGYHLICDQVHKCNNNLPKYLKQVVHSAGDTQ